ncbi:MAG: sensor histidine kinase [Candidatus Hydrothermarchaeales archaeon]
MKENETVQVTEETEEDFRKKFEELKELERTRNDILANVTHELRTPITICVNALELARDETDEEKREHLLNVGKNAMINLNHIVGNLIDMVSIEKGSFRPEEGGLDLEEIIDTMVEEVKPLTIKNEIKIHTKIEKLPKVKANKAAMKHVLFNLITNAIKFNKDKGEINIKASFQEDPLKPWGEGFVEVSISDMGIGIPQEHMDKIFERLYQVDASSTRTYGGTGMGLAVVKEIVEAHDGKIWVESEVDKETKFTFTVPEEPREIGKDL